MGVCITGSGPFGYVIFMVAGFVLWWTTGSRFKLYIVLPVGGLAFPCITG